jgi:hypothetical protein
VEVGLSIIQFADTDCVRQARPSGDVSRKVDQLVGYFNLFVSNFFSRGRKPSAQRISPRLCGVLTTPFLMLALSVNSKAKNETRSDLEPGWTFHEVKHVAATC